MMLLFLALPEEARPFVRAWESAARRRLVETPGDRAARAPRFDTPGLRLRVTGMGPRNALRIAAAALDEAAPAFVVTGGLAGGLDPTLGLGDLVFDADDDFPRRDALDRTGARAARFHGVDRVVATAAAKARLRRGTGADAVDMESAPIRALCRERGVPSATLRVISDTAAEDLPLDPGDLLTPDDRFDVGRAAWAVLRAPHRIPALVRMQRSVAAAAERLATALVDVLALPAGTEEIPGREP